MNFEQYIRTAVESKLSATNGLSNFDVIGRVTKIVGNTIEVTGFSSPIGGHCIVQTVQNEAIEAEIVGFDQNRLFLMSSDNLHGIQTGDKVVPTGSFITIPFGEELLGRVFDGMMKPLDGKPKLATAQHISVHPKKQNPLLKKPIKNPLDVGVRAINGLLTVGKGQRIGLFAGSGVGKSELLGMMTRYTQADVVVIGLIGERGREVKEFIESVLKEEGLSRAVVIASPADDPPLSRVYAAHCATAIAEAFRDAGKDVLLLMDSLTRYAHAQREICLSIGEPPANKGYPPSVFSRIPQLIERAGNGYHDGGTMTAFYTVLVDGDDLHDPVADSARAILDGHVVLSRKVSEGGIYPAIDIERSISRLMPNLVEKSHLQYHSLFKKYYSIYQENKDFINIGAVKNGVNKEIDAAAGNINRMFKYIQQDRDIKITLNESIKELEVIMQQITEHEESSTNEKA